MGGLRSLMPRTHIAFAVGALALMGIPIFSGFWSKDGIVAAAGSSNDTLGWVLYVAGLIGALLTGLYTTRLYFAVWRGEPSDLVREHAHQGAGEGPRSMTIPVGILTVLATIGGLVVIPGVWEPFLKWDRRDGGAARPGDRCRGLRHERDRRRARPDRILRRPPRVRGRSPGRAETGDLAGARAQAVLRRALRRALLSTRSRALGRTAPQGRGALVERSLDEIDPARSRSAARSAASSPASCARTPSLSRLRSASSSSSS